MSTIPVSPTRSAQLTFASKTPTESQEFESISPLALGIILELGVLAVLLGNLLVLLSLKFQNKCIITDVLLFSLSLADVVGGMIPLQAVIFMNYFLQIAWSKVLCDAYVSLVNTCRFASAGTVTLIAVERAVMLVWPFRYHTSVSISRAKKIVLVTWLLSILISALPFTGFGKSGFKDGKCFYHLSDLGFEYAIFALSVSLLLLLTVLACSIAVKLSSTKFIQRQSRVQTFNNPRVSNANGDERRRGNSFHAQKDLPTGVREIRKLSFMMAVVVVLYYVSWLPILIASAVPLVTGTKQTKAVVLATGMISLIYALANPVLYGKMSARYRRGYKCVIGKILGVCGLRPEVLKVSVSEVSRPSQTSQIVRTAPANSPEVRRTIVQINKEYFSASYDDTNHADLELIATEAKQHAKEIEGQNADQENLQVTKIDNFTTDKETLCETRL